MDSACVLMNAQMKTNKIYKNLSYQKIIFLETYKDKIFLLQ